MSREGTVASRGGAAKYTGPGAGGEAGPERPDRVDDGGASRPLPGAVAGGSLATLNVDGVEVPWAAAPSPGGTAPPIVVLPGLGWRASGCALSGYLGADLPVVGLDYPRRWPRRRLDSMAALADVYAGALAALGYGRVHLAGVSMGGMLAVRLALDHPGCVASLALVSTAAAGSRVVGRWRLPASRAAAGALPGGPFYELYRRWGAALVGTAAVGAPREASRLWSDPMGGRKMADLLRAIARFDVCRRLPDVRAPCLVLHGARDTLFPAAAARELVAGIPEARLRLVDGAGHFAFLTHRGEVVRELRRFWSEVPEGAGDRDTNPHRER